MKALGVLVLVFLMSLPLWAAPGLQEKQAAPRPAAQANRAQQIQNRIADLYLSDFRNALELTDEQFLKLGPIARRFIQMRFQAANQRERINQRLDQLLSQPDPSDEDVRQLSDEKERFERNAGNLEGRLVANVRADLTARQIARIYDLNRKFFEEKLPRLLEQARSQINPQARPSIPARPNQGSRGIGDALRGR